MSSIKSLYKALYSAKRDGRMFSIHDAIESAINAHDAVTVWLLVRRIEAMCQANCPDKRWLNLEQRWRLCKQQKSKKNNSNLRKKNKE